MYKQVICNITEQSVLYSGSSASVPLIAILQLKLKINYKVHKTLITLLWDRHVQARNGYLEVAEVVGIEFQIVDQ